MMRERLRTRIVAVARWRSLIARRVAALAVALLVLTSALFAGQPYLFCVMMERSVEACCCEPLDDDAHSESPEVRSACCESHAGSDLAKARAASPDTVEVLPAAFIGLASPSYEVARAAPLFSDMWVSAPLFPRGNPIRAGPLKPSDTCVRLQVFRC